MNGRGTRANHRIDPDIYSIRYAKKNTASFARCVRVCLREHLDEQSPRQKTLP